MAGARGSAGFGRLGQRDSRGSRDIGRPELSVGNGGWGAGEREHITNRKRPTPVVPSTRVRPGAFYESIGTAVTDAGAPYRPRQESLKIRTLVDCAGDCLF